MDRGNVGDEVNLRTVILEIKSWIKIFRRNWLLFLICSLVGGGLGILYAKSKKRTYIADLTFVLDENKGGGLGAYAGIASQFGIDIGGASSSGIFNGDNIIEFLKSRLMVEQTLLMPVDSNNSQSLADYYIDTYNLRKRLKIAPDTKFILPATINRENFSIRQDSILFLLYQKIIKENLIIGKKDKKLNFINLSVVSESEMFSKYFAERLVGKAADFYIKTKTKKSKSNVDLLQSKADSIEYLLNKKTYSAAYSQDLNLNPARRVALVGSEVAIRDKAVLQTMYAEVVKNLELSRLAMVQETPIFQLVDSPILPLRSEKPGIIKCVFLGGLIMVLITAFGIICKVVYKKLMVGPEATKM